jgi:hypothetical protein
MRSSPPRWFRGGLFVSRVYISAVAGVVADCRRVVYTAVIRYPKKSGVQNVKIWDLLLRHLGI